MKTMRLEFNKIKKRKVQGDYATYKLQTVEEIFDILTTENMNRFFKEFKMGMSAAVHMREAAKETVKSKGQEWSNEGLKLKTFTWTDD